MTDWASDYDIFAAELAEDPYPLMASLRATCPVAHSTRNGASWWPTTYADVCQVANDAVHFSSRQVSVAPLDIVAPSGVVSLVMMDPPDHTQLRRLLLDFFSAKNVERYAEATEGFCAAQLSRFEPGQVTDLVQHYTRQIPPRVLAAILGIDKSRSDEFTEWADGILGAGMQDPAVAAKYAKLINDFLNEEIDKRLQQPSDDLICTLLKAERDGEPLSRETVFANLRLMMIAGVDTTWSAIGSALWHIATHPEDRDRLVADPGLTSSAVEEFLRAYAPVTMARIAKCPVQLGDAQIAAGDRVLLSFPAANRDPEAFSEPDAVQLDRSPNRHVAFGYGVHRCLGAPFARMEMRVAIAALLRKFPKLEISDPNAVRWSGGQVRGPTYLPVKLA